MGGVLGAHPRAGAAPVAVGDQKVRELLQPDLTRERADAERERRGEEAQ